MTNKSPNTACKNRVENTALQTRARPRTHAHTHTNTQTHLNTLSTCHRPVSYMSYLKSALGDAVHVCFGVNNKDSPRRATFARFVDVADQTMTTPTTLAVHDRARNRRNPGLAAVRANHHTAKITIITWTDCCRNLTSASRADTLTTFPLRCTSPLDLCASRLTGTGVSVMYVHEIFVFVNSGVACAYALKRFG